MKVLIDTDVLLDVALNRSPHEIDSGKLLDWAEAHPGATALAWHTLANVSYMLKANSRSFLLELLEFTVVPGTSTDAARQALTLPMTDLEDAFQAVAAMAFGAQFIVTRNVKDYRRSPVPALTPSDFLKRHS